jgi:hypothetical protein
MKTYELRQIIREEISKILNESSEFNANKVWDFIESQPFYNKEYMPQFSTAEEIWAEWGPKEKGMYAEFNWEDTYGDELHPKESAAQRRQGNYNALVSN